MNEILARAIAAIKSGDKIGGRKILKQILKSDPQNETAWLWLAAAVDEISLKEEYLNNVLKINPNNNRARQWIERLEVIKQPTEADVIGLVNKKVPFTRKLTTISLSPILWVLLLFHIAFSAFILGWTSEQGSDQPIFISAEKQYVLELKKHTIPAVKEFNEALSKLDPEMDNLDWTKLVGGGDMSVVKRLHFRNITVAILMGEELISHIQSLTPPPGAKTAQTELLACVQMRVDIIKSVKDAVLNYHDVNVSDSDFRPCNTDWMTQYVVYRSAEPIINKCNKDLLVKVMNYRRDSNSATATLGIFSEKTFLSEHANVKPVWEISALSSDLCLVNLMAEMEYGLEIYMQIEVDPYQGVFRPHSESTSDLFSKYFIDENYKEGVNIE